MGPFYELEASSPAAALKPGEHLEHTNLTIHISGQVEDLNKLLQTLSGSRPKRSGPPSTNPVASLPNQIRYLSCLGIYTFATHLFISGISWIWF
jgi:hypothetical protein